MERNIVRRCCIAVLALGVVSCNEPSTGPDTNGEIDIDPAFDVTLTPDGGACPDVHYEASELLPNGVTVTWTTVLAGFDYTEGEPYPTSVQWSVDRGSTNYRGFMLRSGRSSWTPRGRGGTGVDGSFTVGAPGDDTLPVTVIMTPLAPSEEEGGATEAGEWGGKHGDGSFWLRLRIDDGEGGSRNVRLGVHVYLEDPADGQGTRCPGDGPANLPPTANAGPDQTVTDSDGGGDESVTLDGSGSSDPDGSIASWTWSAGGSQIATGPNPTVTFGVGTHTVTLTVADDQGATDTDNVIITVEELTANLPPMANAGPDQTVTDSDGGGDESVTLDGSGSSDPDGSIASWTWSAGGSQIATGPNPTVTFAVGTHTVTLTVTDDQGATDTDNVVITVTSPAVSYSGEIQPYFNANCVGCHNSTSAQKGVMLDSYVNVMAGGNNGPLVVPGDSSHPDAILVPQMEGGHMGNHSSIIQKIKDWIDAGAPNN